MAGECSSCQIYHIVTYRNAKCGHVYCLRCASQYTAGVNQQYCLVNNCKQRLRTYQLFSDLQKDALRYHMNDQFAEFVKTFMTPTVNIQQSLKLLDGTRQIDETQQKLDFIIQDMNEEIYKKTTRYKSKMDDPIIIKDEEPTVNTIHQPKKCTICWEGEAIYATVPCGHLDYCEGCRTQLKKRKVCAICKQKFKCMIRIYQ